LYIILWRFKEKVEVRKRSWYGVGVEAVFKRETEEGSSGKRAAKKICRKEL